MSLTPLWEAPYPRIHHITDRTTWHPLTQTLLLLTLHIRFTTAENWENNSTFQERIWETTVKRGLVANSRLKVDSRTITRTQWSVACVTSMTSHQSESDWALLMSSGKFSGTAWNSATSALTRDWTSVSLLAPTIWWDPKIQLGYLPTRITLRSDTEEATIIGCSTPTVTSI